MLYKNTAELTPATPRVSSQGPMPVNIDDPALFMQVGHAPAKNQHV